MTTQKQWRRWIFCFGILLLGWSNADLAAQSATLNITNLDQLCAGFSDNSTAHVEIVTDTPFRLPSNAGLIFDWYAYHETANKRWNTPLPFRNIPLPWEGKYNVWVVVKYVNKGTLAPFRTFKSPVVTIDVSNCPEEKLRSTSTTNLKQSEKH